MGRDAQAMTGLRDPDEGVLEAEMMRACQPFAKSAAPLAELRSQLRQVMWDDVGVMRTEAGMKRGLGALDEISRELDATGVDDSTRAFNLTWHDWLNLRNLVDMSKVIAEAALVRENSRGAHFREDFPDTGALDASYYTSARQSGEDLKVTREAVAFTIVKPGETVLPADEPESLVG